jgi:L-alanine-DL-glutamate epimerase-like enolase superfamily enzyme
MSVTTITLGNATVARALAGPVQIGENFNGPQAMIDALAARACDYVMPDASRIGVSGWIPAAGIAAAQGIEMSSHLLPEISAHLLAASPTCHYQEYVDWPTQCSRSRCRSRMVSHAFQTVRESDSRGDRKP